jgi:hypothetical protein
MTTNASNDALLDQLAEDIKRLAAAAKTPGTGAPCDRDKEVHKILERSAELLRGAVALGRDRNSLTLSIVLRTVTENLIVLLWVLVSEENAQRQSGAGQAEMMRIARLSLEGGYGKIINEETGEDETAEFLASGRLKGPSSKPTEQCAREAGVLSLYAMLYRPLSLAVHAHGIDMKDDDEEMLVEILLHASGSLCKAIGHVSVRWLVHRQRTDNEALREVLGLHGE